MKIKPLMRSILSRVIIGASLLVVACSTEPSLDTEGVAAPPSSEPVSVGPGHVAPEEIENLPAEPVCATCRLVFGEPFELTGAEADGGTPGGMAAVVRTTDGRFGAAFWGPAGNRIYIYGADGRFESTIGSEGAGPGEFRSIGNGLFAEGNTLHAFDGTVGRRTSIDIRSGEIVGSGRAAGNTMDAAFPSIEAIVLSGRARGTGAPGYPLHVFDREGEWIRSFGRTEPQQDLGDSSPLVRSLTSAGDETFWAAPWREFLLEHWRIDGTRIQVFAGTRERFVPFERGNERLGQKPGARLHAISVDEDGVLWVVYAVAALGWEEAIEPIPGRTAGQTSGASHRILPGRSAREYYLEVIDPHAGRVLVREQLPESYFTFADAKTLVRGWEDEDTGISKLGVVEVRLERR